MALAPLFYLALQHTARLQLQSQEANSICPLRELSACLLHSVSFVCDPTVLNITLLEVTVLLQINRIGG